MEAIGQAGPVRALSHRARRELAATFREGGHNGYAVNAFLTVYGSTLYDFVILMVGPGRLADRVLTDTLLSVTGLARWLQDEDLLTAWVFALARCECRRYPPVVWRGRQWEALRALAVNQPVERRGPVPVEVVQMAMLGIAPRDREILVLSSTYCKLLSSDLAAVFGIGSEDTAAAVATAHQRFEQALGMCAKEVGYRRDPRNRAPEIGELVGIVLSGVDRRLPVEQLFHVAQARELAAYRQEVISRIRLNGNDGFPLLWDQGRAMNNRGGFYRPDVRGDRHSSRQGIAEGDWYMANRSPSANRGYLVPHPPRKNDPSRIW
jgi:DNA-directed RNA polymerase specialized sigma24 family protein